LKKLLFIFLIAINLSANSKNIIIDEYISAILYGDCKWVDRVVSASYLNSKMYHLFPAIYINDTSVIECDKKNNSNITIVPERLFMLSIDECCSK